MSILHEDDKGAVWFDRWLEECIRLGNKIEIESALEGVDAYHKLSDDGGSTLLHLAAMYNNSSFAQHLISLGADVDAQDRRKQTPLMTAIDLYKEQVLRVLLEANADLYVPNIHGQCVLGKTFTFIYTDEYCVRRAKKEKAVILNKVTAESLRKSKYVSDNVFHRDCPLYRFIDFDNSEIMKVLLEKGSPVDARIPSSGKTVLHLVASQMNVEKVKLLVKYGADINARDKDEITPLASCFIEENAVKYSDIDNALKCIETLLELGADPQIFNEFFDLRLRTLSNDLVREYKFMPLFAKIILLEASGQPIQQATRDFISSNHHWKSIFNSVKLQIEEFQHIEISNSVTLFDFVNASDQNVMKFAKNKNLVKNLTNAMKKISHIDDMYYHCKFQKRFLRFSRFVEWRETMLSVIIEIFSQFFDLSIDDVAEKILEYIQYKKWVEISLDGPVVL